MRQLVLASTSPYRKALLERLGVPFVTARPSVDETARPGESAWELVARLGEAKARAVGQGFASAIIIGSDQAAALGQQILGKPGNHARAVDQLRQARGRCVIFYTSLCVLDTDSGRCQVDVSPYAVFFRDLSDQQIDNYLRREQPYDCAGAFKSEGLGSALFDKHMGDDPSALIGLPLMGLVRLLANEGVDVLSF
jgi:MAF protein